MKGLIGRKLGMTQIFDAEGFVTPITLIEAGPCFVTQVKTVQSDGYQAIQLGFEEVKPVRLTGGQRGHLQSKSLPALRYLRELRFNGESSIKEGDKLTVDVFSKADRVDVVGVTKGKGFQGGMKRHGFRGGSMTHGQSDRQRSPGSIGATTTPGRVLKGKRMPGHMGVQRVTSENLRIALVDVERNLVGVCGAVPGSKGAIVMVKQARKA